MKKKNRLKKNDDREIIINDSKIYKMEKKKLKDMRKG
jgi:ABC-type proline/glycine betaine transport system ATPase subunit